MARREKTTEGTESIPQESYLVVLKKSWPGPFRRTVLGEQLAFTPGDPVPVDAETAKALAPDIGKALDFCKVSPVGKIEIIDSPLKADQSEPEATN